MPWLLEHALHASEREGGDGDPAVVEGGEELREALAAGAEQVGLGDADVVETQAVGVRAVPAELVIGLLGGESRRARGDHDRADLRGAVVAGAGACGDRHHGRDRRSGVGDEGLGAVDDPLAVDDLGLGLGAPRIRARLGFGEAEAGEGAPGREVGQPLLLLLGGAVAENRIDAQADARFQGDPHRLVNPTELFDGQAQVGELASRARRSAVLLGHDQTEDAELAQFGHELDREVGLLVPLGDLGRNLGLGEVPHQVTEFLVVLGQLEHGRSLASTPPRGWLVPTRHCLTLTST